MTNKLGNINYQAIMARANADMQKLQSISSGSNWEEILAILQGDMKNQLPGAGKSIFSIGEASIFIIKLVGRNSQVQ